MIVNGYARPASLVSTEWVAARLGDPGIQLIEVDVDTSAYDTGHIVGAVGWHWQNDLQQLPNRDIPSARDWAELLASSGVSNDTLVVLYGDNNNWFAAYAYWLFKLYGHADVCLMNGGRLKWMAEGRSTTTTPFAPSRTIYRMNGGNPGIRAFRTDVESALAKNGVGLVDVRSPKEFSGELLAPEHLPQEGAQRGGHVPGAQNIPWATAVAEDGTFKPADQLRTIYEEKGFYSDRPVIAYCRIGERSAHTWFVLSELLGYPEVRNYDGSWTEWGSLVGAPIAR